MKTRHGLGDHSSPEIKRLTYAGSIAIKNHLRFFRERKEEQ